VNRGQKRENPLLRALDNDTRADILRYIADQGAEARLDPLSIAVALDLSLEATSYHVLVLAECGAIKPVDSESQEGARTPLYLFDIKEPWALGLLNLDAPDSTRGQSETEDWTAADD
jgi:DNA-binding transcriptional ArsR family regulator